jgi:hypothetical protein
MELTDQGVLEVGSDRYVEYQTVESEDKRQFAEDIGEYAKEFFRRPPAAAASARPIHR